MRTVGKKLVVEQGRVIEDAHRSLDYSRILLQRLPGKTYTRGKVIPVIVVQMIEAGRTIGREFLGSGAIPRYQTRTSTRPSSCKLLGGDIEVRYCTMRRIDRFVQLPANAQVQRQERVHLPIIL